MVKRSIDQKLQLRNLTRHWRIDTGAVVKNRRDLIGVEREKGECYQWIEKLQCSKGSSCEECTTNGLCLAGLRAITSEKSEVSGKPGA